MINWIYWLLKKIPSKIPIKRIEEYHTHYLGKCNNERLFWGYSTFAFIKDFSEMQGQDLRLFRKEYAVVHLFKKDGRYLETKYWIAGLSIDLKGDETFIKLEEMVSELMPITYGNIKVELFSTIIDGITFGLIPDKKYLTVDLEPGNSISFPAPWNGEYDT